MDSTSRVTRLLPWALIGSLASVQANAQTQNTAQEDEVSTVVVTGTRVANRSALETAVPVDVVSSETLHHASHQASHQSPQPTPQHKVALSVSGASRSGPFYGRI